VLNIKIGQDGFMVVDVYFTGSTGNPEATLSLPPGDVPNTYMLDEMGNRYEWVKRGGCAQSPILTNSGKGCSGWLIYPTVSRKATTLTFGDDFYASPITGIMLVGEPGLGAVTPSQ
jgi:hypothetical protein